MNYKNTTLSKIDGFLANVDALLDIEFPYISPHKALLKIKNYFERERNYIGQLSDSKDSTREYCRQISCEIASNLSIIGLLYNSSNIRNIFEFHEPFLILASKVLYPSQSSRTSGVHIVISSEWDMSPFVYTRPANILRDYILIGMPASECSNPLLFPLAGHELGHIVWNHFQSKVKLILAKLNAKLSAVMIPPNTQESIRFIVSQDFAESFNIAERYTKELFCDCFGLRLFRESYIHSFLYTFFSFHDNLMSETHPCLTMRITTLKTAIKTFKYDFDFADVSTAYNPNDLNDKFKTIYESVETIIPDIIQAVDDIIKNAKFDKDPAGTAEEQRRIAEEVLEIIPAKNANTLSDIINAGWIIFERLQSNDRLKVSTDQLFDIIAKNFEILTIEGRLKS